ncbi:TetR/AcrR family transcriptional regulator [Streptomyces sp. 8K308]|uniref:TetR/AcrR family transcriptional regulator n=1 Tax=Streptomyces sp. 8K308 TaxID=2530388 RepID=UPI0010514C3C|nr:TetR/AcrR family transcriptional regulator [Streptomyces sp. 8K308]TDC04222.1 TetR/AcrR family transcriptional regulator [Streptomyces sp. 8K308]
MSTETTQAAPAGRRSRLSESREREIYQVVERLLREHGYDALTMDEVAAARASKATLYRRWKTKAELVVSMLKALKPPIATEVRAGTLAETLLEQMRFAGRRLHEEAGLMRGLGMAMHQNPELLAAFRDMLLRPELDATRKLLDEARERGELPANGPDAEHLLYMVLGAILGRELFEDEQPDTDFLVEYARTVILPALGLRA